jgi:hypothetical protein
LWEEISRLDRRLMGTSLGKRPGWADVPQRPHSAGTVTKNTAGLHESRSRIPARKRQAFKKFWHRGLACYLCPNEDFIKTSGLSRIPAFQRVLFNRLCPLGM